MKKRLLISAVCVLLLGFVVFHWSQGEGEQSHSSRSDLISLHELEKVPEGEGQAIEESNKAMLSFLRKQYLQKTPQKDPGSGIVLRGTRRGVHPKAHGCVIGKFTINNNLSAQDRAGIFQPGYEYDAIVRYSNASPKPSDNDSGADSRGMAIKVLNINAEHVLKGDLSDNSQDFTLNSTDTFFADTAENYARFFKIALLEADTFSDAATQYILKVASSFELGLTWRIFNAFQKIQSVEMTNPLAGSYFSISPFQHGAGSRAPLVKYAVTPCGGEWRESVNPQEKNFLRQSLKNFIHDKDACFRFFIQYRTADSLQVEDLTQPWDPKVAPFKEVARLRLPKQDLMDDLKCENLVFNSWNALPAHKPVGGINRLRLAAYLASIKERRDTR